MPAVLANPKNANEISFEQRARDLKDQEQKEQEELKQQRKSPFSRFYQVNKDNSDICVVVYEKILKHLNYSFSSSTTWTSTMQLFAHIKSFKKL